jgi:hypothetical protein
MEYNANSMTFSSLNFMDRTPVVSLGRQAEQ